MISPKVMVICFGVLAATAVICLVLLYTGWTPFKS